MCRWAEETNDKIETRQLVGKFRPKEALPLRSERTGMWHQVTPGGGVIFKSCWHFLGCKPATGRSSWPFCLPCCGRWGRTSRCAAWRGGVSNHRSSLHRSVPSCEGCCHGYGHLQSAPNWTKDSQDTWKGGVGGNWVETRKLLSQLYCFFGAYRWDIFITALPSGLCAAPRT